MPNKSANIFQSICRSLNPTIICIPKFIKLALVLYSVHNFKCTISHMSCCHPGQHFPCVRSTKTDTWLQIKTDFGINFLPQDLPEL